MAKILAVDDSKVRRDMISAVLSAEGHEVITAENGMRAMEIAREHPFNLVLCDINMPGMSGMSLIAKLRRLDDFKFIPIIMVTTETSGYKKEKAKGSGASGWLAKPFTPERLINAVNKLVG